MIEPLEGSTAPGIAASKCASDGTGPARGTHCGSARPANRGIGPAAVRRSDEGCPVPRDDDEPGRPRGTWPRGVMRRSIRDAAGAPPVVVPRLRRAGRWCGAGRPTSGSRNAMFRWTGPAVWDQRLGHGTRRERCASRPRKSWSGTAGSANQRTADPKDRGRLMVWGSPNVLQLEADRSTRAQQERDSEPGSASTSGGMQLGGRRAAGGHHDAGRPLAGRQPDGDEAARRPLVVMDVELKASLRPRGQGQGRRP